MTLFPMHGEKGAALVLISISMVAVGLLGVALLSSVTTTHHQRLHIDASDRAFLAAESGRSYAYARREVEYEYVPEGTFTLENGDRFIFSSVLDGTNLVVTVTGVAHDGTHRESHQALTFLLGIEVPGGGAVSIWMRSSCWGRN